MSATVGSVINCMEKIAPHYLKEDWDNVGLLVGKSKNKDVKRILFALDATDEVAKEAVRKKCEMIITHHPVIFGSIKSVTDQNALGARIIYLIENNITVFSAHTNFDIADQGTNTILAKVLNIECTENLCPDTADGQALGKVGTLDDEMSFAEFAEYTKQKLELSHVTVTGNSSKKIKTVGVCTGSGANRELMSLAAAKNCDAYVTGDLKFHDAQFANEIGLCVIDATHYGTEAIAMKYLSQMVQAEIDVECAVSEIDGQVLKMV